MSDENYVFHANAKKNDFINWIRDVIKDEKLANDLKKAMNHAHAARLVTSRIAALYKRLA
ncbi:MAG: hypothetical protein HY528_01295 [Chloroflexi bacterium]|nr:hypothetical protein [Chloroflexota bacterium]